ncbi:AraC family transcriptional regulator [Leucobacter allii]|uniref:helix-turn-helix transcriptional regulator n=1 Tax=Leucobacter allii TaxID=2932247 RepID=UPI001FD3361F|nr:AraC family transcriptional regulator [Leucobacter allii]UOR00481.1 AraC family transcriptional regulator [Leucobacter allii]
MHITTTEHVEAKHRIEFWESWNQSSLVGLHCSTPKPDAFNAISMQQSLPGSVITRIQAARHIIDRNAQSISAVPKHSVFVSTLLRGSAFIYHAEGMQMLRPGDAFVYSTMHPYLLGFDRDVDLLIVDLDASTVHDEWGRAPLAAPEVTARSGQAGLITDEALRLLDAPEGDPPSTDRLADYCRGLLIGERGSDVLYSRAVAAIDSGLPHPDFDVPALARAVHLSERHLRRVFAEHGGSPGAAILGARLDRARALLAEGARRTVSDVAAACGFGSPSVFARAFRARYGASPSELRGAARQPEASAARSGRTGEGAQTGWASG